MDSHGWKMKGDFNTDNIKSQDGIDTIDIADVTGKATIKNEIRIESGSPVAGYQLVAANNQGDLEFGYGAIALGSIVLFESDTAVFGYSLLTSENDSVVYITKGSAAGGESGATDKSGSTWTQPTHRHDLRNHTHSGPNHRHGMNSHYHYAGSHFHSTGDHALSNQELPTHRHSFKDYYFARRDNYVFHGPIPINYDNFIPPGSNGLGHGDTDLDNEWLYYYIHNTEYTGSGSSHNHGLTGTIGGDTGTPSTNNTEYSGTGNTGTPSNNNTSYATTSSSWRPKGRNFTRQQRI